MCHVDQDLYFYLRKNLLCECSVRRKGIWFFIGIGKIVLRTGDEEPNICSVNLKEL